MCTPTQKDNEIGNLWTVCRMWTFKLTTEDNESKRFYVGWVAELATELVLQQCHNEVPSEDSEIQEFYELPK
jgi:hypothetical protein